MRESWKMPDPQLYDIDHVHAAMCIMEEIADPNLPDAGVPWQDFREAAGINCLREIIVTTLAGPCNADWERAYTAYMEDETGALLNPGSFEYDSVPTWLRLKVDWSDVGNGPRVRGAADGR